MQRIRNFVGDCILIFLAFCPWLPWDYVQITKMASWTHRCIKGESYKPSRLVVALPEETENLP